MRLLDFLYAAQIILVYALTSRERTRLIANLSRQISAMLNKLVSHGSQSADRERKSLYGCYCTVTYIFKTKHNTHIKHKIYIQTKQDIFSNGLVIFHKIFQN